MSIKNYTDEFKNTVKGENLGFWISVYVPANSMAGEYSSKITIITNNGVYIVPVRMKVFNFSLPKRTQVQTQLFSLDVNEICKRYNLDLFSSKYENFIVNIFSEYVKHRISAGFPTPIPLGDYYRSNPDSVAVARYYETWCRYWVDRGLDCNNIQLPKDVNKLPNYKSVYETIKRNDWLDRVYARPPMDEAKDGGKAQKNLAWTRKMKEIMPGIRILQTLGGLERGLSQKTFDLYSGSVDIWSFVPEVYLNDVGIRKTLDDRVKMGEHISWYLHRSLNVWQPRKDLRYFFWNMWNNKISMVTLWRTTFWSRPTKYKNFGDMKVPRVPEKKTWREKRGFSSTESSGVGNGTLFWPDNDRILTSIRLETIRDGIEDYEYFVIAKQMNIPITMSTNVGEDFVAVRTYLGEQIEKSNVVK
jgi:hypothetical protein